MSSHFFEDFSFTFGPEPDAFDFVALGAGFSGSLLLVAFEILGVTIVLAFDETGSGVDLFTLFFNGGSVRFFAGVTVASRCEGGTYPAAFLARSILSCSFSESGLPLAR